MVELHLPPPDLALYVMGALEAQRAAMLERHVQACDACAAALSREAQLEMQLIELVETRASEHSQIRIVGVRPVVARDHWRKSSAARAAGVGFAGLAAAAAVALFTVATARTGGSTVASGGAGSIEQPAYVRSEGARNVGAMTMACPDGADGQVCGVQLAERSYDASSMP